MLRSLSKMADPRAQEVLSGDCGLIHGQHTLTVVFRSVGDFPQDGRSLRLLPVNRKATSGGGKSLKWKGVLKMATTSDGFPIMGKLPPVAGRV